jgi:malate dehydrogenase (oxaloacetate-decarboxylating)
MKIAAAEAIAGVIPDHIISEDFIIPSVFDQRVSTSVADAVAVKAQQTGVARRRRRRSGGEDDDRVYATRRMSLG